ncbi:MAG TPA: class II aldolase/adducin family protein [Prolixibacteraceae bacterium]|nr:class II aldolase/adducin family protein [Prolixibacteraceae bacterium]
MDKDLQDLIRVSRLYGSDPSFVIAGGGNTSFKNEEKIWIKASGISLATIDENGFVSLSRAKLKLIAQKQYSTDPLLRENEVKTDLHEAIVSPKELRPSVETSLHELISYRYVVHTHPTVVNGVMCSLEAEKTCKEMFGEKALFVPYTDPGYILFKVVAEGIRQYTEKNGIEPGIIFLENHGVFVGADTTLEIEAIYAEIMSAIGRRLSHQLPATERGEIRSEVIDQVESLHPGFAGFKALGIKSELTDLYLTDETSFSKANKSFTPDDIVYCKAHYLYIPAQATDSDLLAKTREKIAAYFDKYGYMPKVLTIQHLGIIAIEESIKSAQNVLDVYENILKISFYSENFGGPKFMNDKQIAFIDNWEVENYRRKIAKS